MRRALVLVGGGRGHLLASFIGGHGCGGFGEDEFQKTRRNKLVIRRGAGRLFLEQGSNDTLHEPPELVL